MSVRRDTKGMFLSQKKYALELLDRAHMGTCHSTRTPVDTESKLRASFPSASYATVLRYVCHTLDFGLQLYASSTGSLVAYSDSVWAGCPTTRCFTSGYCVFLGDNLLSWSFKRQHTLSRSSNEAEYRGVANAVAETAWLPNPVQHQRTKHIEIDIHFIHDMVTRGKVRVLHVPSRYYCVENHLGKIDTKVVDFMRANEFKLHFYWVGISTHVSWTIDIIPGLLKAMTAIEDFLMLEEEMAQTDEERANREALRAKKEDVHASN
ncbi:ribonuclease H-like domain-containing protein [Tanacetum coccineum]|uniref:Ribonuclease H-like domain-containing protein n=1 Tax=Tanacetum coccineum TaxID=301880 RepID=A0ABQ5HM15_9ASTR